MINCRIPLIYSSRYLGHSLYYSQLINGNFNVYSKVLQYNSLQVASNCMRYSSSFVDKLIVTEAGWFQSFSQSWPVEKLMTAFQYVHDITGLSWWASIILSTISLRVIVTFPPSVYQNYITAKLENLKPEMDSLLKNLKTETAFAIQKYGWDEQYARVMFQHSAKKTWKNLIERENCHPFKSIVIIWLQLPLWIGSTVALRNLTTMQPRQDVAAETVYSEMSLEGFGWILNLTDIDAFFILPVTMAVINLIITEMHGLVQKKKQSKWQKLSRNLFRGVCIAVIPISAFMPSGVLVYWVTSSLCALCQNVLLLNPRVRRAFGIPITPSEHEHPYLFMQTELRKKFSKSQDKNHRRF